MQAPGFWDDSAAAAKISAEHARATSKLKTFTALASDVEDLDGLVEIADEDDGDGRRARRADRVGRGAPRRARGGAPVLRPATTPATRS